MIILLNEKSLLKADFFHINVGATAAPLFRSFLRQVP